MIRFKLKGSFKNTDFILKNGENISQSTMRALQSHAEDGIRALNEHTPRDTGITASSWRYRIDNNGISFYNDNINDGIPIVVLIQYGHLANGSYVAGKDFINPALKPIFDKISVKVWKELTGSEH